LWAVCFVPQHGLDFSDCLSHVLEQRGYFFRNLDRPPAPIVRRAQKPPDRASTCAPTRRSPQRSGQRHIVHVNVSHKVPERRY
jgi:hypothetical protein